MHADYQNKTQNFIQKFSSINTRSLPLPINHETQNKNTTKFHFKSVRGLQVKPLNKKKLHIRWEIIIHQKWEQEKNKSRRKEVEGEWRKETNFFCQNMRWVEMFGHSNVAHIFYEGKLLGIPKRHGWLVTKWTARITPKVTNFLPFSLRKWRRRLLGDFNTQKMRKLCLF